MSIFTGSGVAIVTPFSSDGAVNYDEFGRLVDFHLQEGTDSIVVCGTTGEASTLTDDEQIECVRFVVDKVKKKIPVIAGAGSNDTEHGLRLLQGCQKAGADAALLVTPYYNKTTQKGLIEHYTYLASRVDTPIIIYSVPSRTGMNITPKAALALSKIDNIVAIKEASGDLIQIAEIAALCGGRLDIYSGTDELNIPIMSLGAKGCISVVANLIPKDVHDCINAYLNKDFDLALSLHLKMLALVKSLFMETSPIPVKAALQLMGYNPGRCKMPLTTIEPATQEIVKSCMQEYGIL